MIRLSPLLNSPLSQIEQLGEELRLETDADLKQRSASLGFRAQSGESKQRLLPEAFALVREAATRTIGMRHYEVQLRGAISLAQGAIIEMETGQGKTLTATPALYLDALRGKGAHLATSNDYLADRDAKNLAPLFGFLGLTTGCITEDLTDRERQAHYACDITYGTLSQFGFDLLRDRLRKRALTDGTTEKLFQVTRPPYFLLADEADALLIDEANTPLIIGVPGIVHKEDEAVFRWASQISNTAREHVHFKSRLQDKTVTLTETGRNWGRERAQDAGIYFNSVFDLYEKLEKAILVHRSFQRDQHYIVRDGEITIVNEATGRLGVGRQWQAGIHQAIQAAEDVEITASNSHAAKITIQGLALCYEHLAGMTGTAAAASKELRKVYKKSVARIPPRQKSQRTTLKTTYCDSEEVKLQAICQEIMEMRASKRPILIGTRSVEKSDKLSAKLKQFKIPHHVLNAREHQEESEIIASAGKSGSVTVATGMAGRGTDILLDDESLAAGGLHVILTELQDSPRQDRQLLGRCGRQGEPGSHRLFLSSDDAILDLGYGPERAEQMRKNQSVSASTLAAAQNNLETRKQQNRVSALYHEKRRLRSLWEMGRDPLLDDV